MGQVETGSGRSNSPLPKGLLGLLYDKMVPEVQTKAGKLDCLRGPRIPITCNTA